MGEVTTIPSKAVVRQAQKPASPEAGLLWYDTQAEVLKQYKNGSFQNVGSSVDGKTIIKNSNGNIQTAPNITIIGDFENNSNGKWTTFSVKNANGGAESSDYYLFSSIGNIQTTSRNADFTGVNELEFYYRIDPRDLNDFQGTSNSEIRCEIGNNTVFTQSLGNTTNWIKVLVDTSNISGSKTVKLIGDNSNSSSDFIHIGFDRIKLIKQSVATTESNGAGGT